MKSFKIRTIKIYPLVALLLLGYGCPKKVNAQRTFSEVAPIDAPFDMPSLQPPSFPANVVDIRKFGATGDGKRDNTRAFSDAIAACSKDGGGRVLVPEGTWLTGPIHLKSNIELHLVEGAVILFSTRFEDYLPAVFTRKVIECHSLSPLIYAIDCENIAVTGPGELNGQGDVWGKRPGLDDSKNDGLMEAVYAGVPVEERILDKPNDGLKPSFIETINSRNVYLQGFTIKNGPSWMINPVYCENVVIRHCRFEGSIRHGALAIGSEMSGDIRNVLVRDCYFNNTARCFRIKSRRGRGGVVENIWIRDIAVGRLRVGPVVLIDTSYGVDRPDWGSSRTATPPIFRNIHVQGIRCEYSPRSVELSGLPEQPIENITLEDISIVSDNGFKNKDTLHVKQYNVNIVQSEKPVDSSHQ